ncbi:MAG: molybdenum cofactor guanylyltransferase [Spirochaetales bacterium]|jgi:molybdopterin-guanine dinucleotide biosynthesis protein A
MATVTIAILAGGKSSRFRGIDKQEIIFNGEKLGRIAARNALAAAFPVIIVGRNHSPYEGLPVVFTEDILPGFGPLSGLHAALSRSETKWVYLMACDMPFFSEAWLSYLLALTERTGLLATAAQSGRYAEPFHALYSRELIPRLESVFAESPASPGRYSFSRLISEVPHLIIPETVAREYSPDWRLFYSVNSPSDLEALQKPQ